VHGTRLEDTSATVSEVLVSLSTEIALKLASTGARQHTAQFAPRHGEVGKNIHEHRRQIRLDHSRALRDADDAAADVRAADFRVEVRGDDALCGWQD
jgi:hypothetical protein